MKGDGTPVIDIAAITARCPIIGPLLQIVEDAADVSEDVDAIVRAAQGHYPAPHYGTPEVLRAIWWAFRNGPTPRRRRLAKEARRRWDAWGVT